MGSFPNWSWSFPLSKLPRALAGKFRIRCLKFKGVTRLLHYQSVPLLCKVILTASLFNCEPFRGHCSSYLNISNICPKKLSFMIDEIFTIFISLICILAWRIPWTEELSRLYSPWACKESDMTERLSLTHLTATSPPTTHILILIPFANKINQSSIKKWLII